MNLIIIKANLFNKQKKMDYHFIHIVMYLTYAIIVGP